MAFLYQRLQPSTPDPDCCFYDIHHNGLRGIDVDTWLLKDRKGNIEDIWLWPNEHKCSIFTSGGATRENITSGVHVWNKNWSYTEKVKFSVSFML